MLTSVKMRARASLVRGRRRNSASAEFLNFVQHWISTLRVSGSRFSADRGTHDACQARLNSASKLVVYALTHAHSIRALRYMAEITRSARFAVHRL